MTREKQNASNSLIVFVHMDFYWCKSTLAHLFTNYVNEKHQHPSKRVLAVCCSTLSMRQDIKETVDAFLTRQVPIEVQNLLTGGQKSIAPHSHNKQFSKFFIVVDEGQMTYFDRSWWNKLKGIYFDHSSIKYLVFVFHGSNVSVPTPASSDFQLLPNQVIRIGRHNNSNLSLFFI